MEAVLNCGGEVWDRFRERGNEDDEGLGKVKTPSSKPGV